MGHNEPFSGAERRHALRLVWRAALAMPLAVVGFVFLRPPRRAVTRRVVLCRSADVGTALRVIAADGMRLGVRRDAGGQPVAFDMACTHAGCLVEPTKAGFRCPCHGGTFTADGQPAGGPVRRPLRKISLQEVDGMVVATVDET